MPLEIGSTLGDYQIIGILGAGGMGRVYKVRNLISDRVEAMKVLLPDLATAPDLADRFIREIKVQASLEHPNIAALHTAVRAGNQLLMIMEYLEGFTLEQRLQQGRVPVPEAVGYIRQVLAALAYAHERGVVHRDVKPANMMVVGSGTLKLMDFGIAKAAGDQRLTMTGTTMGSLYYMSPEQIKGATDIDARADLYSVGVSLYELVTGKRPFDGDSQFAIMAAHLEKAPVPPISIDPSLPQSLNDLILMAVAKDPDQRFQTANAFRNALESLAGARPAAATADPALSLGPAAARETPLAQPSPDQFRLIEPIPPSNRKRGLWMALGAIAAALTVIAAVQFGPWKGSKAAPQPATAAPAPAAVQPLPSQPASPQPTAADTNVAQQPPHSQPAPASHPALATQPAAPPSGNPTRASLPGTPGGFKAVDRAALPSSAPVRAAQSPVQTVQQPPIPQPAPPSPNSPQPEVLAFREHLMLLGTRAESVRSSLQTLRQQQAASGLNLRGDVQETLDRMNAYLQGARDAVQAGDLPAARSYADKGERQLEILEKFLNR
jgi:hypothetical protein